MIAALSFVICIAGLILFYVTKGDNREIAKCMFWVGLLAFLFQISGVFAYFGYHR